MGSGVVFTEAYTPGTLIALMENEDREAIEIFRCRQMRRAAYRDDYKLITVGDQPDELFNVIDDPGELNNLIAEKPGDGRAQPIAERVSGGGGDPAPGQLGSRATAPGGGRGARRAAARAWVHRVRGTLPIAPVQCFRGFQRLRAG